MATDGTQTEQRESGSERFDQIFAEAVGDLGIDPNEPFATDGTEALNASQGEAPASSPETPPEIPPAAPTGDDGAQGTADAPPPAAAAPASPDPTDDLSTAKPLDYTVNGETKTIEGTYRIPGEGLIVPEEHVARVQQMASRADELETQSRALAEQLTSSQQRDATWQRLSSWDIQGPDGKPQTVSGERGLAEMRLAAQRGAAILSAIGPIFDKPEMAAQLVQDVQGTDGNWYRIWNQDAIEKIQLKAALASQQAERQAWGQIGKLQAPPAPSAPSSDEVVARAPATVAEIVTSQNITGLTDADRTFLAAMLPQYMQPDGLVKREFVEVVKDRAALRAEATKQAQTAATQAAAAQKFNNGMQGGKKPPVAARPATPPAPTPERKTKASDWDKPLNDALPNLSEIKTWDDAIAALNQ